jgi:hypothetical protein
VGSEAATRYPSRAMTLMRGERSKDGHDGNSKNRAQHRLVENAAHQAPITIPIATARQFGWIERENSFLLMDNSSKIEIRHSKNKLKIKI